MDLGGLIRYWSLTVAVFIFFLFAILVAFLDVFDELRESARKRRAQRRPGALDPNPLVDRSVAATILPGPGQRLDARRLWVAQMAGEIAGRLGLSHKVQTLVLEDSKGHALVHFTGGARLQSYRVDRAVVEAAMAGDASKAATVADLLERHLAADFLGREDVRPPRTTELAREAGARPAPAGAAPAQGVVSQQGAAPSQVAAAGRAEAPAAAAVHAGPAAPAADADTEKMSREERLAAARAKAEALKAARQASRPPESQ